MENIEFGEATVNVRLNIISDGDTLATCECKTQVLFTKDSYSSEWKSGIYNEAEMAADIQKHFNLSANGYWFRMVIGSVIWLAVQEYIATDDESISHDVDIVKYMLEEKI